MGAALLKDADIKRWCDNLSEGSPRTADVYLAWLQHFADFTKASPTDSVLRFKSGDSGKKEVQDSISDFIHHLLTKGFAPKSLNGALSAVRSWFRWNECLVTRQIKIRGLKTTPTIEDERLPTRQELNQALNFGDLRQKIAIGTIAFAGLRFDSTAKLHLKDLLDVRIENNRVIVDNQYTRLRVVVVASKNKRPYFVFSPAQLTDWVRQYLESRARDGEQLGPESSLLVTSQRHFSHGRFVEKGQPLSRQAVAKEVRLAFKASGQKFRPYVMKSYFSMALQSAGLTFDKVEFYLGHVGPMSLNYGMRKELPKEKVEELRTEFVQKVEPVLTGAPQLMLATDVRKRTALDILELLESVGLASEATLRPFRERLEEIAPEEVEAVMEEFRERMAVSDKDWLDTQKGLKDTTKILPPGFFQPVENRTMPLQEPRRVTQVVVSMKQAERLIPKGYTYVGPLNGKAVLKVPEGSTEPVVGGI